MALPTSGECLVTRWNHQSQGLAPRRAEAYRFLVDPLRRDGLERAQRTSPAEKLFQTVEASSPVERDFALESPGQPRLPSRRNSANGWTGVTSESSFTGLRSTPDALRAAHLAVKLDCVLTAAREQQAS